MWIAASAKRALLAVREAPALLDGFELELHHFPAHHVAQIVLPKFAIPREMIHQEFKPQPTPQREQFHVDLHLPETRRAVIPDPAVVLAKIAEGKAVQMPAVRGIAE